MSTKFDPGVFSPRGYQGLSNNHINDQKPLKPTNGFTDLDYSIQHTCDNKKRSEPLHNDKLTNLIHVETHANGGASVVHMYQEELAHLGKDEKHRLAINFFNEVMKEKPKGVAQHVMGIVHNAATYMPELVQHLALYKPDLAVKIGRLSHLSKNEIETVKMEEYLEKVQTSYSHGTFRYGPLMQLSIVGQVSEESGGYFPEFLGECVFE